MFLTVWNGFSLKIFDTFNIKLILMKQFGLFFLFLTSLALYSQDTIYTRRGEVINAKVEEVGIKNIKYKKASNSDGPLYTLGKSEITLIQYKNGSKDVFPVPETIVEPEVTNITNTRSDESEDEDVVVLRPVFRVMVNMLPGLFFGSWSWGVGWNGWGFCQPLNNGGNHAHHSGYGHYGRR